MTVLPGDPILTASCRAIVAWAAAQPGPLDTRALLVAIMRTDTAADWQRVWLHTGTPDRLAAVPVSEPEGSLARAVVVALAVRDRYRIDAVTPGVLALGLVGAPGSGAAQAVATGTGLTPDRFAHLVMDNVIGLHPAPSLTAIAAGALAPPPPPVPPPAYRVTVDPVVMAGRQRHMYNRFGHWLLTIGVALVVGGIFPFIRNTGAEDGGLAAMVVGALLTVGGLVAVRPRWRRAWGRHHPRGVRTALWTAWAGWACVVAGVVLAFVPTTHVPAAVTAGVGAGLLVLGYGRAVLAMPAADRRPATAVDTALLAVFAACVPALLLGWLGWAMLGNGDHAARYGARVEVVEAGACRYTYPVVQRAVYVCQRAAWRTGAGLRRGAFYSDYDDAHLRKGGRGGVRVFAFASGDRAFGPKHVGDIDPLVALAPAAPWLALAVPVAVLCAVTVYWRRTPDR